MHCIDTSHSTKEVLFAHIVLFHSTSLQLAMPFSLRRGRCCKCTSTPSFTGNAMDPHPRPWRCTSTLLNQAACHLSPSIVSHHHHHVHRTHCLNLSNSIFFIASSPLPPLPSPSTFTSSRLYCIRVSVELSSVGGTRTATAHSMYNANATCHMHASPPIDR